MEKHKMMNDELYNAIVALYERVFDERKTMEIVIENYDEEENFFERDDYVNYHKELKELEDRLHFITTWNWNYEDCI